MQAQRLPLRSPHFTVIHRPLHRHVELPYLPSRFPLSRSLPAVHGLHLQELNSDISRLWISHQGSRDYWVPKV
jgi:hypothetical protein